MKLEYTIYVDAEPEKVWEALVSPEGTRACFFGSELTTSFEEGSSIEYAGTGSDGEKIVHVYGTVETYEPNRKLVYIEHPGPTYHQNHAELTSRVAFDLSEAGTTTKLTLINDQWSDNHPSFENSKSAWPMILSSIKTWCETGKTLDFGF
ncbi:polyketide cyclase [Saccharibacillus sp. O23]|uniref:SRPBCC domain-containing protein n=1 Tax=Saccharibacillus sp. O23 TaxID=2009338 RepID=UPI000B4E0D5E|nr:SRPBCC domain-containing protein [Saccharibacillus sp. O23]OWR31076.1 polyketide cyclase [Saccharibacillus sp. O23]